jgi:hypothetical protein
MDIVIRCITHVQNLFWIDTRLSAETFKYARVRLVRLCRLRRYGGPERPVMAFNQPQQIAMVGVG